MAAQNPKRGMDATAWLSTGLAVMVSLPLVPRVMNWMADKTRDGLMDGYGPEFGEYAIWAQNLACLLVTGIGFFLLFDSLLRIIRQKISRAANALRR